MSRLSEIGVERGTSRLKGAKAGRSAVQSIPGGIVTVLNWNTELWDTNAFHNTVTNNSRFVVPTGLAGVYEFSMSVRFEGHGTGRRETGYRVDAGPDVWMGQSSEVGAEAEGLSWTVQRNLTAGQYVEFIVSQNSGGALDVEAGGGSFATMRYLGTL